MTGRAGPRLPGWRLIVGEAAGPRGVEPLTQTTGQVLRILQVGDPADEAVLRQPARPVERVTREIRRLLDDMLATMYHARGVGLAAPQVGVQRRVIVVDVGDGPIELINPEVEHAEGCEAGWEGCLSIPGVLAEVERAARVRVRGLDRRGRRVWVEGEGLLARALQHEVDHLDGVLILDRARRVVELPPETRLRLVFMGTPEFAVPVLERLLEGRCQVVAVVTRPERPRGRGLRPQPTPVARVAEDWELPLLQPESAGDPEFVARLRELEPDVAVVCAYGLKLPREVLEAPRLACINVHPSLLPAYRGAEPIRRALMDGVAETGVTVAYMDEGMDTGDILLQRAVPVEPDDTYGALSAKLASVAAELVPQALALLATGQAPRVPQDHARATVAPRLRPAEELVDWNRPAAAVVNHLRALDPAPGARTLWRDRWLKVFRARVLERPAAAAPGTVVEVRSGEGFGVAAADRVVWVEEVQPAGGRRMPAGDFVNGYRLRAGERLAPADDVAARGAGAGGPGRRA